MQTKMFKILATAIIMIFLFGFVSGVAAAGKPQANFSKSNGQADISTGQATISVNGGGNVPFYHIKLNNSNDTTTYEVKFSSIQEFVDKNGNGLFDNGEAVPSSGISFPSLKWDFSGFYSTNDSNNNIQTINFNFTSTSTTKGPFIQLRNHIDVSKGNQIKFDLLISDYKWTSTNSSAKLAVKFQIAGGNLTQGANNNDISFGNAQFSSVSTASTPDGNINVNTQIASGNSFYLLYDHFNSNFTHDPTFSAVVSTTSSSTKGLSLGLYPIVGGLAIIGIVFAKKRHI